MSRSLRVHPEYIDQVKLALKRNGYPRQKDLAEELEISLSTLNNYLNGRPVDNLNFQEISEKLGQDWKAIALLDQESTPSNSNVNPDPWKPDLDQDESIPDVDYYVERPPIETTCY
ncbi:MAG: helix-turn-helix transcriptional regulator, partial [Moorea sp. SIO4E2]